MILLNFAHPLSAAHLDQVAGLVGHPIIQVVEVVAQFDTTHPFAPQVAGLVTACGLSAQQWQTAAIVINPPALNYIAVALLADLHGRMGYFPPILRLAPVPHSQPPRFAVVEILALQALRDTARQARHPPD